MGRPSKIVISERAQEVIDTYKRAVETRTSPLPTLADIRADQTHTRRHNAQLTARRYRCKHIPAGCGASANPDSGLCFWHDPARHIERLAASEKGGKAGAEPDLEPVLTVPLSRKPSKPLIYKNISPTLGRVSVRLKSCPRCRGDLYYDYDQYGKDTYCVQCGYRPIPADVMALAVERQGDMKPRGRR